MAHFRVYFGPIPVLKGPVSEEMALRGRVSQIQPQVIYFAEPHIDRDLQGEVGGGVPGKNTLLQVLAETVRAQQINPGTVGIALESEQAFHRQQGHVQFMELPRVHDCGIAGEREFGDGVVDGNGDLVLEQRGVYIGQRRTRSDDEKAFSAVAVAIIDHGFPLRETQQVLAQGPALDQRRIWEERVQIGRQRLREAGWVHTHQERGVVQIVRPADHHQRQFWIGVG